MAESRRKRQPAGLPGRAEEISEILKLLGNPQRLLIACLLCEGEYAVSEIEEKLGIRQPTLSQQLGALREAGVIEGRREAKAVIYHLAMRARAISSTRCIASSVPRDWRRWLRRRRRGRGSLRRRALRPSLASPREVPGDGGGCQGCCKRFESISLPSVPQQIRSR